LEKVVPQEKQQGAGSAVRLLRFALGASLVIPAMVLMVGSWLSYRAQFRETEYQISREADVLHEHALKVFETTELIIDQIDGLLGSLDDDAVRAGERALHERLAAFVRNRPQIRDVWVVDARGKPLLSAVQFPVPRDLDLSDRDYYSGTRERDALFVGEIVTGRTSGTQYFNIAGRRRAPDGSFDGAVTVAVVPQYFASVHEKLFASPDAISGVIRADGSLLARYPELPATLTRMGASSGFLRNTSRQPEQGIYETASEVDGVDRIYAYRKLEGLPLYVYAARDRGTIVADWLSTLASHLAFGLPATLCLFGITFVALRRSQRADAEAARRESAEAALYRAQKMDAIGQLTGGVAHDFNNLLTVITGNLDLLERQVDDVFCKRLIASARRGTERGVRLTQSLLAFGRRQRLQPEVVDINQLIRDFGDLLRRAADEAIDIQFVLGPRVDRSVIDPAHFQSALLNLVVNARDAMPPAGGRIVIETRNIVLSASQAAADPELRPGPYVEVAVSDNAGGMPPEVMARAFEPFFTTKDVGKGTGLGLSQVYGFVKQSGGHVQLTSKVGVGTSVKLYLPRADGAASASDSEAASSRLVRGGPETILVVEDDPDVLVTVVENLRELKYRALTAADGAAALALLERGEPVDLLFSDVVMPKGIRGDELARRARALRPELRVLLTSGYTSAGGTSEGVTESGDPLLLKPYRHEDLARAIRDALG
jgi:signal transduction histidine kinase/CheY-like chemotaxis protein